MKYLTIRLFDRAGDAVGLAYPAVGELALTALLERIVEREYDQQVVNCKVNGMALEDMVSVTLLRLRNGRWLYLKTEGDEVPDLDALRAGRYPVEVIARCGRMAL